jgi:hypothetical protein
MDASSMTMPGEERRREKRREEERRGEKRREEERRGG